MKKKSTVALISPNENGYSETFIQQHRKGISENLVYYYGGILPKKNDKSGVLLSRKLKIQFRFQQIFKKTNLSMRETALANSFKKEGITVVVAEYGITAVAVLKVCKHLNIPLIPIFHGYDASKKEILEKYSQSYKTLFNEAFKIISVSQKIAKTLITLGCNSSKITISPCAPNDSFSNIKLNYSKPLFVGIGRFVDKKAPYYTILAFSKVLKKYPEAKLLIAGNGVLYNMCKNLVRFLKIEQQVILPGIVAHDELKNHFTNALAFVQHSITAIDGDMEGTPVAILEAGIAGLPVIATKHAGIPDVILNNETGFLVEEHDVDAMAEKMMELLENPEIGKKMGEKSKAFIQNNFSQKIHLEILNKIIKEAVK